MKNRLTHSLFGGMDLSVQESRADINSFGLLLNFRQASNARGELQQTPYFNGGTPLPQQTYWNAFSGTSATEPSDAAIRLYARNVYSFNTVYGTDYTFSRGTGVIIPAFYQTVVPAAETINTNCFIKINNVAGLGLTLGSTLDIVIDSATTFKWRKNGGAYTTLQPCTITGTSIDSGNVTVYFLTTGGFTVNDTWSWLRTDSSSRALPGDAFNARPMQSIQYKDELFIINMVNRICRLQLDTGNNPYIISVGYRPVFGRYFQINNNHLFVGGYATTSPGANVSARLVCSDNQDLMNFFSTSTNEADEFNLSFQTTRAVTVNRICGLTNIGGELYVFSESEAFKGTYLGLPYNYTFVRVAELPFLIGQNNTSIPVVEYDGASVFIVTDRGPWQFDGTNFQFLGQPIRRFIGGTDYTFGVVSFYTKELIISHSNFLLVYQLEYGLWYIRMADFDANVDSVTFLGGAYDLSGISVGMRGRVLLTEDSGFNFTPVKDTASGTLWATPCIVTQLYTDNALARVKEIESCYLAVRFLLASSAADYYTNPDTKVQLSWYDAVNGAISSYNPLPTFLTAATAVLDSTSVDGLVSFPRFAFRALCLQIKVLGPDTAKPVGRVSVVGIEPVIYGLEQEETTR